MTLILHWIESLHQTRGDSDTTNRYKLAKQADVLMLIYLFGPDGLAEMLRRLGYPDRPGLVEDTVEYYLGRTAHGSTLSRVVHASVLARMDPARGWRTFREALAADLDDTQGGTTREGIHLGAMAGTIDIITRAFAGIRSEDDVVVFEPRLPEGLRSARFTIVHRGQRLRVVVTPDVLEVHAQLCATRTEVRIRVGGENLAVAPGERVVLRWTPRTGARPARMR
jgi:trehalose/maltose hydrolase-like predicted phosphorylase